MTRRRLLGDRPINKPEVMAATAIKRQQERLSCGCVVYAGKDGKETDCPHSGAMVHEKCAECGHDFTAAAIEKATLTKAYNDVTRAHAAVLEDNEQLTEELERVNAGWSNDREMLNVRTRERDKYAAELATKKLREWAKQRDHETLVRRLIFKARDLSEGISKCRTPEEMAGVYDYIQKDAEEIAYIVSDIQRVAGE